MCLQAVDLALYGAGEVLFSLLKPGTHLRPHCGPTNARLTAYLGMVVPKGCQVRAGEEWKSLQEGKCFVFDDSWEHEVRRAL